MLDRRQAVGFIEAEGLPAAIAAADAAVKSANVRLVGRESSRGAGLITIKVAGDVGAVKAALEAARAASDQVRHTRSTLVIPRPAEGIGDRFVWNADTIGAEAPAPGPAAPEAPDLSPDVSAPLGEGDAAPQMRVPEDEGDAGEDAPPSPEAGIETPADAPEDPGEESPEGLKPEPQRPRGPRRKGRSK